MNPMHVAAVVAAGIAAFTDYRSGRMPNRVTLGALAVGLAARPCLALAESGSSGFATALASCAVGGVVTALAPLLLWRGNALGGGDVKLFIALGVLLGPVVGLEAQMMAFAAGALFVPFRLAYEGRLFATLGRSLVLVTNAFTPAARRRPVDSAALTWFRLGPMILVGTVLAVLSRGSVQ